MDTTWEWNERTNLAFRQVKEALLANATMAYFNPKHKTELVVDASPIGLGAVLLQENGQAS